MSDLLRVAVVGTARSGESDAEASPVAALVGRVPALDRERALLLRAGAHALLRRAARVLPRRCCELPAAPPETLRPSSTSLTAAIRMLLDADEELLAETLERMVRGGMRLAPELLPLALVQTSPALRAQLRPVLGQRGAWLARQRPEWAWATPAADGGDGLPPDFERRWSEGSAAERRQLFALVRQLSPAHARELAADTWKQERADQRAAFVDAFATGLHPDDQAFLTGLLGDRSTQVQQAAARLLWRLPGSEVAQRMLARARAHVTYCDGAWHVRLPAEPLDPSWERDGIRESPPHTRQLGMRQWWLLQLMAAVPCATWLPLPADASTPSPLTAAARKHALAGVLLDGLTQSALTYDERAWFAPLWDAWAATDQVSALTPHPRVQLSAKLTPQEITARTLRLLAEDELRDLLPHLPRPWPEALSLRVLSAISELRLSFRDAIHVAARAIPVELLPDAAALPHPSEVEYPLRAFVRALESFQQVTALRRSIAAETASDR